MKNASSEYNLTITSMREVGILCAFLLVGS